MKLIYISMLFLVCNAVRSQDQKTDLKKNLVSTDRKEMLLVIKAALAKDLRLTPKMIVSHLSVRNGFAFFKGAAKDGNGNNIDFSKTAYKEALKNGVFDGDGTVALLKKLKKKWTVVAFAIGATDVPYTCWWNEFKAPKDIFDYTEPCR